MSTSPDLCPFTASKPLDPKLEIEQIVDHKIENDENLFLIKWKDLSSEFNVWLPTKSIPSMRMILDYCRQTNMPAIQVPTKSRRVSNVFNSLALIADEKLNEFSRCLTSTNKFHLPNSNRKTAFQYIHDIIDNEELRTNPKLIQKIRKLVLTIKLMEKRPEQLKKLQEQEFLINSISDNREVIRVRNDVDMEILPEHFKYVNNYVMGPEITRSEISDPMFSCTGNHKWCSKKCQCMSFFADKPAYDKNGTIVLSRYEGVHECNKLCSCGPQCGNRVVQKGSLIKVEIFRSATGTGWGVRALEFLPRGTFVGKYVGVIITWEKGELLSNSQIEGQYLFDIDYWTNQNGQSKYTVDAFEYGNFTRFINHSCSPNLTVYKVWINCLDPHLHEIAFFTTRNVEKGQELTFNYRKLFEECRCGSSKCVPKKPR